MSEKKYRVQLGLRDKEYGPLEVLDESDLPLKLGQHEMFTIVTETAQGTKRVRIIAVVEKARP